MVDIVVLTNARGDVQHDARRGVDRGNTLKKMKTIFTDILKNVIHPDPHLSLLSRLPYFIAVVSLCEVFTYELATKAVWDVLIYNPSKICEIWRFISYMLLHKDPIHLGLNVILQFVLGAPLEFEQGHLRTAAIYIGGGLAGSLGASVFDKEFMLVGASGGIYALLISQISHVILNYRTLNFVIYRSMAVLLLALADLIYISYHVYMFNNESPRIGLAAHFSGAVSGLLLGNLFFKGSAKWRSHLQAVSAAIAVTLHALGIAFNIVKNAKCPTD